MYYVITTSVVCIVSSPPDKVPTESALFIFLYIWCKPSRISCKVDFTEMCFNFFSCVNLLTGGAMYQDVLVTELLWRVQQ